MKLSFILVLFAGASALAQSVTPTATPPPCVAPEFRQFDFWLGKWNVINPRTGKQIGTNEITRAADGCAIREQWKSSDGDTGMSINYYDLTDQKWHQDWVGGDGVILHLHGELAGKAMILSGETKGAKETVRNRITWTPLDGGKVKQEWSTSSDDGRNWKTVFVGIYEEQTR
jgi:hypothetical protein